MKTITNKTILKQGDKEFQPRFVMPDDTIIYWIDFSKNVLGSDFGTYVWSTRYAKPIILGEHENSYLKECFKIMAQSQPRLEGIPVISLDNYVERLAIESRKTATWEFSKEYKFHFINGYKANPNQYTKADIDIVYDLAKATKDENGDYIMGYSRENILKIINSISLITVNDNWEVISYE
jgi:hypothetical protein